MGGFSRACCSYMDCEHTLTRIGVTQAGDLPSKETRKQAIAAAAAQIMKQAVMNHAPSCKIDTPAPGTVPTSTLASSKAHNTGNRLPAHDAEGKLLPGLVTQNRLDKVRCKHALSSCPTRCIISLMLLLRAVLWEGGCRRQRECHGCRDKRAGRGRRR
jgi:hypothetical protein